MKTAKLIFLAIPLAISVTFSCSSTTNRGEFFLYNIKCDFGERVLDTLVPLTFLLDSKTYDLPVIQYFQEFNYPKLEVDISSSEIQVLNNPVNIIIKLSEFDSLAFEEAFLEDSIQILSNPYFNWVPEFMGIRQALPKTEIQEIKTIVRGQELQVSKNEVYGAFDPNLFIAYKAETSHLILQINCGAGAGAYIQIYIFDNLGALVNKIEAPVL